MYEALTANDRPYKTAKTPETALDIMREMASTVHIDPELFSLFEQSNMIERYSAKFKK
ncbi:HD domain-containing phosphohydrolase [Desulfobacter vibrioformis]|uniref:HD domain-containing phosphohydrolase n=1 Tax=Desulfobacter vibrioformis TaxID=34031 RepID=UPI003CCC45EA